VPSRSRDLPSATNPTTGDQAEKHRHRSLPRGHTKGAHHKSASQGLIGVSRGLTGTCDCRSFVIGASPGRGPRDPGGPRPTRVTRAQRRPLMVRGQRQLNVNELDSTRMPTSGKNG